MPTRSFGERLRRGAIGAVLASLAALAPLAAQTTTGTLRGNVTTQGQPATGATVTATNAANGAARSVVASGSGTYIITGLVPGQYDVSVRRVGLSPQVRRATVGIGQVITLDIALEAVATQLSAVTVQGTRSPIETRTSEVATNVTAEQIANLPTADRNFLGLASLAPGVRISGENAEGTTKTFRAGALDAGSINVFIDGASQKNDVTGSGIAGQDASRGNPFPQNAVQEFRVITQNFKAEYQKASSAIIVATTKSGGNTWRGSAFGTYVNDGFVALDTFQRVNRTNNPSFALQDYRRYLAGATLGGPLVKDKLFFFGSYEMNNQNRAQTVNFGTVPSTAQIPADVQQRFTSLAGAYTSPFRSNLFLAKLNWTASERTNYELSYNGRFETDVRSFGGQTSIEASENVRNKVNSVVAKRSWSNGPQLHETLVNFSRWNWDPTPENRTLVGLDYQGIARLGGRDGGQSIVQDRYSIRHDFTYTGFQAAGDHVFKVGGNFDHLRYDFSKTFVRPPVFRFNAAENFAFPREAQYGTGDPDISADNNQFGLYAQDDWSVTKRLQFNLGVRWDVETNQFDRNYVTPSQVRADLDSVLRNRGFDTNVYFSDGNQRKIFYGAVQPRVGFSYALNESQRTVLFGSYGLFYDRSNFNNGLDERFRLQYAIRTFRFSSDGAPRDGFQTIKWDPSYLTANGLDALIASGVAPKPEVFLVRNDQKPPVSTQYSAGIRQVLGSWRVAATYTNVASKNGYTYIFGNRNAEGNCCASVGANYSNVLLSDNNPRTWYQAFLLQVDRPYAFVARDKFNWGAGIAYTYAQGRQRGGDLFSLDYPTVQQYPKYPTSIDVPNLLVANWLVDIPYLWGIQWSGVIRLHSGDPYTVTDESQGTTPGLRKVLINGGRPAKTNFIVPGDIWGYRNVDMRLRKDLFSQRSNSRIGVTADLFNAFNYNNYGCFNGFIPQLPATNASFGAPGCVIGDARRFQVGLAVDF